MDTQILEMLAVFTVQILRQQPTWQLATLRMRHVSLPDGDICRRNAPATSAGNILQFHGLSVV